MAKTQSVSAFPLQWPKGFPRTAAAARKRSQFGKGKWLAILAELDAELGRLGATHRTLSSNLPLRQDEKPYTPEGTLLDPGVAVYFTLDGEQVCFPCDRWLTIQENIRAVTLHINSMRGQQRWGVGAAKQAFSGYKALTSTAGEFEPWWTVLGLAENASVEAIQDAYRKAVLAAHPDRGGSDEQLARINTARDRALADKEVR